MSKNTLPKLSSDAFNGDCVKSYDVYKYLNNIKRPHCIWILDTIKKFHGKENIDFIKKSLDNGSYEYYLTVDFTKSVARYENSDTLLKYLNTLQSSNNNDILISQLKKQISDNIEKIEFFDTIAKCDNLVTLGTFAKLIGWGEKRFFKQLRADGYLCTRQSYYNTPYQKHIERGLMDIRQTVFYRGDKAIAYNQPMITTKGEVHFAKKYSKR